MQNKNKRDLPEDIREVFSRFAMSASLCRKETPFCKVKVTVQIKQVNPTFEIAFLLSTYIKSFLGYNMRSFVRTDIHIDYVNIM